MCRNGYLGGSDKNSDISVRFLDLDFLTSSKMLVIWKHFQFIFFTGKAKSLPYFYFRFMWPTDLESVPRDEPPRMIISIKFEVDTNIRYRVIALLLLIRFVTLTFDHLTLDTGQTWWVTRSIAPPNLKILSLSVMTIDVRHRHC